MSPFDAQGPDPYHLLSTPIAPEDLVRPAELRSGRRQRRRAFVVAGVVQVAASVVLSLLWGWSALAASASTDPRYTGARMATFIGFDVWAIVGGAVLGVALIAVSGSSRPGRRTAVAGLDVAVLAMLAGTAVVLYVATVRTGS